MKASNSIIRLTMTVFILITLAACSGSQTANWESGSGGSENSAPTATFTLLHSFADGTTDGARPQAGVILDTKGNLYGQTFYGGTSNLGTVFKLDTSCTLTLLHSFAGGPSDGARPVADLLLDNWGNLYGMTTIGGAFERGIVFKIDKSGNMIVLHHFAGGATDGAVPFTRLIIDENSNLYGTTQQGGLFNEGTIFTLNRCGDFTLLHSFNRRTDGTVPNALVRDNEGNLYGSTEAAGDPFGSLDAPGFGTLFKLDKSGRFTVLHVFIDKAEGLIPNEIIRDNEGNLFGTTKFGGTFDKGTVFKFDSSGKLTVLHSFALEESIPLAGLVMDNRGNLYGTTSGAGEHGFGFGTVFKFDTTTNTRTTLHTFSDSPTDGRFPLAGLVLDSRGNLYGTTVDGGAFGFGTVFKVDQGITSESSWTPMAIVTQEPGLTGSAISEQLSTCSSGL